MGIWGILTYEDAVEVWCGSNDTHQVVVSRDAMLVAYQIITLRGRVGATARSLLKNLDTCLEDAKLATLEGVEISQLHRSHHSVSSSARLPSQSVRSR